jgi:hypothetical protein
MMVGLDGSRYPALKRWATFGRAPVVKAKNFTGLKAKSVTGT